MAYKPADSGVITAPTVRSTVFGPGQPASTTAGDYGVATATAARPDCFNPPPTLFTNPPSATSDLGSA